MPDDQEQPDNEETEEQGSSGRLVGDDDEGESTADWINEQLGDDEDEEQATTEEAYSE